MNFIRKINNVVVDPQNLSQYKITNEVLLSNLKTAQNRIMKYEIPNNGENNYSTTVKL